jgi:predicted amidohydrolase
MHEPAKLKVAVAQIESMVGDLPANLRKHLDVIAEARAAGANLLLFPELSLTGYIAGKDALACAILRSDPMVREIAAAAGEMCTVFGCIEEGPAAQFHNTCLAVRNGGLVFLHHKVNLPTYGALEEGKHFAGGRYVETFALTPRWRASILICADLWNPALAHLVAVHGTTVLMAPISSAVEAMGVEFDTAEGWDRVLGFYAMIYGMPVMVANRVGAEGNLHFWGGSRILDPFGRVVAKAGNEEALVTGELDYQNVRQARYRLPTLRDSNLDLILRETERLAQTVGVPVSVRND